MKIGKYQVRKYKLESKFLKGWPRKISWWLSFRDYNKKIETSFDFKKLKNKK